MTPARKQAVPAKVWGGVQKALPHLVEQGIVLADVHPSATFVTLNRQVDDLATKIRQWTGNAEGILDISTVDLDRMQVNRGGHPRQLAA